MPPGEVQWQPALVVLASALAIGGLLVWWLRGRGASSAPGPGAPVELRDLDGRLASLLAQLRELEAEAAKRTPEQLARERYALEIEAARVLAAREPLAASVPRPSGAPAVAAPGSSARGFVWGVLSTAAAAFLLVFVWQSAEQRPAGGGATGAVPGGPQGAATAGAGQAADAQIAALRASLEKNPADHDTRLELARELLLRRDLMGVWNETQEVLTRQPGHPRALSYQALVRLAMGQGDMAVEMLRQALAADPELLEARQNLAFVYASLGRSQEAEAAVADVAKRSPQAGEELRRALADLAAARPAAGAAAEGEAHQNPHEGMAAPAPAASAAAAASPGQGAAAPAPGAAAGVYGWIEADPAVRIPAGTVVFLTVRPAGVAQGPPVAVKRLVSEGFPLQFELGTGDSMMGQPLPERMRIDVRADSDGDPMTRPASDPSGHADDVGLGRTGVRIRLR